MGEKTSKKKKKCQKLIQKNCPKNRKETIEKWE